MTIYQFKDPTIIEVPGSNMKVINMHWLGGNPRVCAVLCEDSTTKQTIAFVGPIKGSNSELGDAINIAQWGAKLSKSTATSIFGPLEDYKYD